jgi:EAL domain-containing protein (putative c-di-GMP-specific phosphodiesterase class I)
VSDTEPGELLRAADITLYWAKADGGGRWAQFDPHRNAGQVGRYALAAAVPSALRKDEFDVVYQPIINLRTGEVSGVEALARWRHPDLGMLGPDQFIALAEENAHIIPLGRRILERACQQARQWHDQIRQNQIGPDQIASTPFVSVNLAVLQTRDPGLVEDVNAIVDQVGLPPGLLQLEITESALMDTDENALTVLRELVDLGVRLVLDDFGTGYSNLAYLGKLPICGMKLAGGFAARVESPDPVDRRILAAVVNLAHEAGLEVTAECVETPAQARHLGMIGCDAGQGWLFGRPVPGDDLTTLVGRGTPEAAHDTGMRW